MVDVFVPPPWLVLSVVGACLTAGAGVLPGLVLAARITAHRAKRSAYERCAHQLTFLGACFGAVLMLAGLGLLYADRQGLLAELAIPSRLAAFFPLIPCLAGLSVAAGLFAVLLRFVAVRSFAATCLAVLMAACIWGLLAAGAALGLVFAMPGTAENMPQAGDGPGLALALGQILAGHPVQAGGLLLCLMLAGMCAAGGLALIMQVIRRGLDDYGRDYYMLAARWCAGRALWGGAGLLLVLTGLAWLLWQCGDAAWVYSLACAGGMLCPVLAWLGVARSDNPLRWKVLMVVAVLGLSLVMGGIAAQAGLWMARLPN